jgi:protein mago nashi
VLDDGKSAILRYANNSNYKNDNLIRKEATISPTVVEEIRRIITESEILQEDDKKWPRKNRDGKQELEIRLGAFHISFEVSSVCFDWLCFFPKNWLFNTTF